MIVAVNANDHNNCFYMTLQHGQPYHFFRHIYINN